MITDIISSLEFLGAKIKEMIGPEAKKRKLGKQLLELSSLLQQIASRGNGIVALAQRDFNAPTVLALATLTAQQEDLRKLGEIVLREPLSSILKLHIDDFQHLPAIGAFKAFRIGFFIDHLFGANGNNSDVPGDYAKTGDDEFRQVTPTPSRTLPPTDSERALIENEYQRFIRVFGGGRVGGVDPARLTKEKAIHLMENSADALLLREQTMQNLDNITSGNWRLMPTQALNPNHSVRLFFSQAKLDEAQRTVEQIDEIAKRLHVFVKENFTLTELL